MEGGLGLLDVKARNDAIDLVWVREYLSLKAGRATWTSLADALLARAVAATAKRTDPNARVNAFLQTWEVSTRTAAGLPPPLLRLVRAAKKYGVALHSPNPREEVVERMPIWYHLALVEGRDSANCKSAKCLRTNHKVMTVAQCAQIAARAYRGTPQHRPTLECECRPCIIDRVDRACENPARCVAAAGRMIAKLKPKWNPTVKLPADHLTLTKTRLEENCAARSDGDRITFNPTVSDASLAESFRVFTDERENGVHARRPVRAYVVEEEAVVVYTDGSCSDNGLATARAGSGVWFGEQDARNRGERVPGSDQSNQIAEIYAVTMAHRATPPFAPLHIVSD
ncbi:hypothetical protein C8Q73DRAFT_651532, partial [Cubamyces lactineus]